MKNTDLSFAIMLKTQLFITVVVLLGAAGAFAEDWPARLRDSHRSGITSEDIAPPLTLQWQYKTPHAPAPAWTESPAKHDDSHSFFNMKPRQNFDSCFDVAVVGDFVYFGSSATGVVTCLNANTGSEVWLFFTGGPVRFAPHVANGNVYVGSDDGFAYCLNAADGSLIWSERAGPSDKMIWGNQRMISLWPVRSSLLVDGKDVFWTAGLFPEEGMYVCKRNAADGKGGWKTDAFLSPQGYILASSSRLFVPSGKTCPTMYAREDGKDLGPITNHRDGGCWAMLTPDENTLWTASGFKDEAKQHNVSTKTVLAYVDGGNYMVADSQHVYYNTDTRIIKINRSDSSIVWSRKYYRPYPYSLIKAGSTLFLGADGEVAALEAGTGQRTWVSPLDGKAHGLAAANGRLFVSTDKGSIYCFKNEAK